MDLEWDMVLTTLTILLGIILSDTIHTDTTLMATIHTATIPMVTTHTARTMVSVVATATTHTVTVWAEWDGVDMATGMDGSEMETVGEVQGTTVNRQMLPTIIADQRV